MTDKHGHNRRGQRTVTYRAWAAARNRCSNPNNKGFKRYGKRGITFDPRWDSFAVFLYDMGTCPEGLWLDRRDNNGPYTKDNCRWATRKQQARNRRNNHYVQYQDRQITIVELSELTGVPYARLIQRINKCGWPVNAAATLPRHQRPVA